MADRNSLNRAQICATLYTCIHTLKQCCSVIQLWIFCEIRQHACSSLIFWAKYECLLCTVNTTLQAFVTLLINYWSMYDQFRFSWHKLDNKNVCGHSYNNITKTSTILYSWYKCLLQQVWKGYRKNALLYIATLIVINNLSLIELYITDIIIYHWYNYIPLI